MSWRIPKTNPSDPAIRKILFPSAVLVTAFVAEHKQFWPEAEASPLVAAMRLPNDSQGLFEGLTPKEVVNHIASLGDEEVDAEHLDGNHWLVLAKPGKVWRYRAHVVLCKGRIVQEIVGKPH